MPCGEWATRGETLHLRVYRSAPDRESELPGPSPSLTTDSLCDFPFLPWILYLLSDTVLLWIITFCPLCSLSGSVQVCGVEKLPLSSRPVSPQGGV